MRVNEVEKSENYQEMAAEVERKLRDEMERWERQIVSGNFLFDRRPSVVIGDFCVRGKLDEGKSWTDQIYVGIFFVSARQNSHVITALTASYRRDVHPPSWSHRGPKFGPKFPTQSLTLTAVHHVLICIFEDFAILYFRTIFPSILMQFLLEHLNQEPNEHTFE